MQNLCYSSSSSVNNARDKQGYTYCVPVAVPALLEARPSQAVKAPMIKFLSQFLIQFFPITCFLCQSLRLSLALSASTLHQGPSNKPPNLPKSSYIPLSYTSSLSLSSIFYFLFSHHQTRSHHTPISFSFSPIPPPIFHRSPSNNVHFLQLIPATSMRMD
jgi:hypothetical protein